MTAGQRDSGTAAAVKTDPQCLQAHDRIGRGCAIFGSRGMKSRNLLPDTDTDADNYLLREEPLLDMVTRCLSPVLAAVPAGSDVCVAG